jgi:ribose-phosphate pyrophosphokinase
VTPVVLALPAARSFATHLADALGASVGTVVLRRFPDGESYVRIGSPVAGAPVVVVAPLDRPDRKTLRLMFLAATARDLGAESVGLVAPYLAYLRQDRQFRSGEAVTSIQFARLLSGAADWLVTVDPHLHRVRSLVDLYAIPVSVVHAAPKLADWILRHVHDPLIIGPDAESAQWTDAVAHDAHAPGVVLEKRRLGDRRVEIELPDLSGFDRRTPVLVDDIISTGRTMAEAARRLRTAGFAPPVCVAVHGLFAEGALAGLRSAGVSEITTCNTVAHPSNRIDVSDLVADAVRTMTRATV